MCNALGWRKKHPVSLQCFGRTCLLPGRAHRGGHMSGASDPHGCIQLAALSAARRHLDSGTSYKSQLAALSAAWRQDWGSGLIRPPPAVNPFTMSPSGFESLVGSYSTAHSRPLNYSGGRCRVLMVVYATLVYPQFNAPIQFKSCRYCALSSPPHHHRSRPTTSLFVRHHRLVQPKAYVLRGSLSGSNLMRQWTRVGGFALCWTPWCRPWQRVVQTTS